MSWIVALFTQENTVEVIPDSWTIDSKECLWPPFAKRVQFFNAVKNRQSPDCSWKQISYKLLGSYDDLQKAQAKCRKALESDALSSASSNECNEKFGKGHRVSSLPKVLEPYTDYEDSEESNQDNYPNVPVILSQRNQSQSKSSANSRRNDIERITPNQTDRNPTNLVKWPQNSPNVLACQGQNKQMNESTPTLDVIDVQFSHFLIKFEEFQRQVMRELYIIKVRVKESAETLNVLMQARGGVETQKDDELIEDQRQIYKKFPLKTEDELMEMETFLQDKAIFNIIAKELALVGGDTIKHVTNRIMNTIITIHMGTQYSWEGFKGKKVFKNLALATLIIRSERLNKKNK